MFKSGFVVSMVFFFLVVLLDGKVIDWGCSKFFGLVEVKCFYFKFYVSFLEVCVDEIFYVENVNGKLRLKRGY